MLPHEDSVMLGTAAHIMFSCCRSIVPSVSVVFIFGFSPNVCDSCINWFLFALGERWMSQQGGRGL